MVVFVVAAAGLAATSYRILALVFVLVIVVNAVLMALWGAVTAPETCASGKSMRTDFKLVSMPCPLVLGVLVLSRIFSRGAEHCRGERIT